MVNSITFEVIDRLVQMAQEPLDIDWIKPLQEQVFYYVSDRINYYKFLHLLVEHIQPEFAIELGVEFGIASAYMIDAAMKYGGHVIGVDHNWHDIPGKDFTRFYNYTFMYMDIQEAYSMISERVNTSVGLVFQDSSHHYNESCVEWELYSKLMYPGAVWVCDDILPVFHDPKVDPPGKSMVEYFNERSGEKRLYPKMLNKGGTIGVIIV